MRAASVQLSISESIDEAVRLILRVDQEYLATVAAKASDPDMS